MFGRLAMGFANVRAGTRVHSHPPRGSSSSARCVRVLAGAAASARKRAGGSARAPRAAAGGGGAGARGRTRGPRSGSRRSGARRNRAQAQSPARRVRQGRTQHSERCRPGRDLAATAPGMACPPTARVAGQKLHAPLGGRATRLVIRATARRDDAIEHARARAERVEARGRVHLGIGYGYCGLCASNGRAYCRAAASTAIRLRQPQPVWDSATCNPLEPFVASAHEPQATLRGLACRRYAGGRTSPRGKSMDGGHRARRSVPLSRPAVPAATARRNAAYSRPTPPCAGGGCTFNRERARAQASHAAVPRCQGARARHRCCCAQRVAVDRGRRVREHPCEDDGRYAQERRLRGAEPSPQLLRRAQPRAARADSGNPLQVARALCATLCQPEAPSQSPCVALAAYIRLCWQWTAVHCGSVPPPHLREARGNAAGSQWRLRPFLIASEQGLGLADRTRGHQAPWGRLPVTVQLFPGSRVPLDL